MKHRVAWLLVISLYVGRAFAQPAPAPAKPAQPAPAKPAQPAPAQPADPKQKPLAPGAAKPAAVVALVGGTVHTGTGEIIEQAVVVLADGKIRQVTRGGAAPAGAEVIDVAGSVVTAGLVDPLTAVGLVEVDLEKTTKDDTLGGNDRIRAAFRAADGYNPASSVIGVTRAGGVTSVGVVPTGGLISGQSAWADLDGLTAADALAAAPLALHVHLEGGADPEGGHATALLRVREAFDDARTFQRVRAAWERNQSRAFAPSRLDLEALTRTLDGKLPVVFHVDRAPDIVGALALAKEFKLRPVIAGGAEAWRIAATLAASKVPVIVFPLVSAPETFDALGARDDSAARLHAAGVQVVLSTGETHNARKLRQVAGNAVRAGLPHAVAIAAITRAPAEALGMGDRYGTIAPGKVANVVVWSGDPLELSTEPRHVWVRGRRVPLDNRQSVLRDKYRRLPRPAP
jgi:imidazolonepropionase-like amidohydrolase